MVSLDRFDTRTRANEGVEIELKHVKTGEPMGCFITVLGTDSDAFRRLKTDRERQALDLISKKGADGDLSAEEREEAALALLAGCTVGWRELEQGGKPLVFSPAAAAQLYRDYPPIREQVDRAIANRANFLLA